MQRNPYWPLKGPSFFWVLRFRRCFFSLPEKRRRLQAKSRGTDGKPTLAKGSPMMAEGVDIGEPRRANDGLKK
jgi:hypothetical protein